MMTKFWHYLKGWKGIALICYMWLILMAYVIVYVDVSNQVVKERFYIISVAEVILIALMYICPKLLSKAERLSIKPDSVPMTKQEKRKFFLKSWLTAFGIFFVLYIIFYPGAFELDMVRQYRQAAGLINYNDWHPVLHTLFMFTLPLTLSGGWIGSILLFQIIITSASLAYMFLTLAEYGNRKYARVVMIYTLINPASLCAVMFPWKDISFAVFAMLSTICAVRIYFSRGEWLKSWVNILSCIIFLSCTTIFRHNAILFTLPLLLVILIYSGKTQKIFLITGCCAFIIAVRGGLYPYLGVEKPEYRVVESTRAPMTVIANAVYEAPEKLDKDVLDFFDKVTSGHEWKDEYILGAFNSITHVGNANADFLEESGYIKILCMMFKAFRQSFTQGN